MPANNAHSPLKAVHVSMSDLERRRLKMAVAHSGKPMHQYLHDAIMGDVERRLGPVERFRSMEMIEAARV